MTADQKQGRSVNMKKHPSKNQVSLLLGVLLLIISACGPRATPVQEPANSIVISTFTASPDDSSASQVTFVPTFASTPDSSVIGKLPGLSPKNVTVGLEGQNFTCTAVEKKLAYYEQACLKGLPSETLSQVVIYGRQPFIVDFIEASVKQNKTPDPKVAAELLSFIAGLPYDGATPQEAKAWIESTISAMGSNPVDAQEKAFGGVNYVLHGTPAALTLEMGELP